MSITIREISEEEFNNLQVEWNALLDRSRSESVFLRWEWIYTWWQNFKENRQLHLLAAHSGPQLVGIAPFYVETAHGSGIRSLRLCSDDLGPDYLDVIVEPEWEAAVGSAIARYLQTDLRAWDILALDNLKQDAVLQKYPPIEGLPGKLFQSSHHCPLVKIQGTVEEYMNSRAALKRFSLQKKEKTLFEQKGVIHKIVQTEDELHAGLKHLFQLHAKRAQAKSLQTNFTSSAVERFHWEVGRRWLPERIVSLQLLYAQDEPICAHYLLKFKKRIFYYQSGFDPAWSHWSPSMVLLRRNIQQAFSEGAIEFDFLKGTETYKTLWSNAANDEDQLLAYNTTWRGNLTQGARAFKRWITNTASDWNVLHRPPQVTPGN